MTVLHDADVKVLLANRLSRACSMAWQRPVPWEVKASFRDGLIRTTLRGEEIGIEASFVSQFEMALMSLLCFQSVVGVTPEFGVFSRERAAVLLGKALLDMSLCDVILTPFEDVAAELDDDGVEVCQAPPPCVFADVVPASYEFLVTMAAHDGALVIEPGIEPDFVELSMRRGMAPLVVSVSRRLYDIRMAAILVMDAIVESKNGLRNLR